MLAIWACVQEVGGPSRGQRATLQTILRCHSLEFRVAELIQKSLPASANVIQNAEQQKQLDALIGRFDAAKARIAEVTDTITSRNTRRDKLDNFIRELAKQPEVITEWDDRLFVTLVDYATAHTHNDLRFTFKDGTEIAMG